MSYIKTETYEQFRDRMITAGLQDALIDDNMSPQTIALIKEKLFKISDDLNKYETTDDKNKPLVDTVDSYPQMNSDT